MRSFVLAFFLCACYAACICLRARVCMRARVCHCQVCATACVQNTQYKWGSSRSTFHVASQLFTYVLVIDFEATCWQEKRTTHEISKHSIKLFHTYGTKACSVGDLQVTVRSSLCTIPVLICAILSWDYKIKVSVLCSEPCLPVLSPCCVPLQVMRCPILLTCLTLLTIGLLQCICLQPFFLPQLSFLLCW